MLITGLVLTAFFLLVAIFAPLIAPYSYAQLKGADGVSFPAQAAPSSEHIWGTTAGGYDVFSRVVWVPAPPSSPSSSRYCCRFSQACCSAWSPAISADGSIVCSS